MTKQEEERLRQEVEELKTEKKRGEQVTNAYIVLMEYWKKRCLEADAYIDQFL